MIHSSKSISFLKGSGEIATLIRAKDWSKTSLGDTETWPQSLRTTLSIILNSKFPMFLFWGPEHICFYNDAYRPSLGNDGKHPAILGSKGAEFWKEIWKDIKPLIDNVLQGGEANWSEDQLLPIYRNGAMEDVYWTFSYSAVHDETGAPAGVFVTCNETTKKVHAVADLQKSEEKLSLALDAAELATWHVDLTNNKLTANNRFKNWFGYTEDKEITLENYITRIAEDERDDVVKMMEAAFNPALKNSFEIEHSIINSIDKSKRILLARGKVLFTKNNVAFSFSGTGQDITEKVVGRKNLEESEKQIKETKNQLELTFANVPAAIFLYGKNKELLFANERAAHLLDYNNVQELLEEKNYEAIMNRTSNIFYVMNENDNLFARENLPTTIALESNTPTERIFSMKNRKSGIKKWLLNKSSPILDVYGNISMVLTTSTDITAQKLAEETIRNSEKRFRSLADEAPMWVWIADKEINIQYANIELLNFVGLKHYSEFSGQVWQSSVHQDDLSIVMTHFQNGVATQKSFEFEARIKNATTGNYEWFYLKAVPHIEEDIFTGFIGTAINIQEKKAATEILEYRKALLESNNEASLDGALLVDANGNIISYNKRFVEIWNMPAHITEAKDDKAALEYAMSQLVNPDQFIEKVKYLYDHPTETSKDELEYKDGKIIERYGYPVVGDDGTYYAWSWIFRDITQQKKDEQIIIESEERFRVMAETLPQLIWVTDEKGNREYASGRWKTYTGINPEGKTSWKATVHPDDFDGINAAWKRSLKTGEVYKHEVRLKSKDGEYRWFAVRGEPVFNSENIVVKWVGAFTDIHSEKSFAQALKTEVESRTKELASLNLSLLNKNESLIISESFNRALTDVSPNVVYIFDIEKNIPVFLNKTALDIIGYEWETFYKMDAPLKAIVHPYDIKSVKVALQKMKTSAVGEVIEHQYRIKNKIGDWVPFLVRETAFKRNNKEEVFQILGIGVDITEIKKSKNILEQKNTELEKINKELQSFAYISSHDLQEPLRKIQTFTNYIIDTEKGNLTEKGNDYFKRIRVSAARMRQLIDDLLAYSRAIDTNVAFEEVHLNSFIEEIKADFLDNTDFHQATIKVNAGCSVEVIAFQFRQLITNLISNALKFKRANVPSHITITSKTEKGSKLIHENMDEDKLYCRIKVKDNGIGFDPRYSKKIFDVFQRLHGKAEYEGTGIGLAIVKKIIENHQGFIVAKGEVGDGAEFDVYLPN